MQSRRVSLVERIHNAGEFRDLQTAESAKPRGPVRLSSRIGESEVEGPAELVNPVVARIVCT